MPETRNCYRWHLFRKTEPSLCHSPALWEQDEQVLPVPQRHLLASQLLQDSALRWQGTWGSKGVRGEAPSSIKWCYSNGEELLELTVNQRIQSCVNLFHLKPKICDLGWKVFRDHAALAEIKGSSPFIRGERCPTCFGGELLVLLGLWKYNVV